MGLCEDQKIIHIAVDFIHTVEDEFHHPLQAPGGDAQAHREPPETPRAPRGQGAGLGRGGVRQGDLVVAGLQVEFAEHLGPC